MSQLQFLLIFLVAPCALLLAVHGPQHLRLLTIALAIAAGLALIYTVPWAYVLVREQVWDFPDHKHGATLWRLPWETFASIALQAVFTGTLAALALRRAWWRK